MKISTLRGTATIVFTVAWNFFFLIATGMTLDCPNLHILPSKDGKKVLIEGIVMQGSSRTGLSRRDRLRGLFSNAAISVKVELRINRQSQEIILDDNGSFSVEYPAWEGTADIEIYDPAQKAVLIKREVTQPFPPGFIVVTDIDDTIMISEVPNRLNLIVNSLFTEVKNRKPVPGTAEAYKSLANGSRQSGKPLIFYLSCSPAAMGRFIEEFIKLNDFPQGILCIKRHLKEDGTDPKVHKIKWLKKLAKFYPGLPFLLLGDSGEKDPEIFCEFAAMKSVPIMGIIIRKIANDASSDERFTRISSNMEKEKIPFYLWTNPESLKSVIASMGISIP